MNGEPVAGLNEFAKLGMPYVMEAVRNGIIKVWVALLGGT